MMNLRRQVVPRFCGDPKGSALLATLGVLAVLSALTIAFFSMTRIQRRTSMQQQRRMSARNHLDLALYFAMQTYEDALCITNFTESATNAQQRLVPVGPWFSEEWRSRNAVSQEYNFQVPGILLSPLLVSNEQFASVWSVNLLTPEVCALMPPSLTNQLEQIEPPLRAGWHQIEKIGDDTQARMAFALLDISGFLDANYFVNGPTTQKLPRMAFDQRDVVSWEEISLLAPRISDNESPFSALSYDPDPDVEPFERHSILPHAHLGTFAFPARQKFNVNSITNSFLSLAGLCFDDGMERTRLITMPESWFRSVTGALIRASIDLGSVEASREAGCDAFFGDGVKIAWNIVNYMTGSRIPTAFENTIVQQNWYPSRLDYAIEAVPMINEVGLKHIFGGGVHSGYRDAEDIYHPELERVETLLRETYSPPPDSDTPQPPVEIEWSNFYAYDIELWYPFQPAPLPERAYLWTSVTTNAPPLFQPTASPHAWLEDFAESDLMGEVLFRRWHDLYQQYTDTLVALDTDFVWGLLQTNELLITYIEAPESYADATNHLEVADSFAALWEGVYTNDLATATTNQPFARVLWETTKTFTNELTQAVIVHDDERTERVDGILQAPYKDILFRDGHAWAENYRHNFIESTASFFADYSKHPILPEDFSTAGIAVYNITNSLIYFPYAETNYVENSEAVDKIIVKFHPLQEDGEAGGSDAGDSERYAWLRPMITLSEINISVLEDVPGIPETVDEALLTRERGNPKGYLRWGRPGYISIPDPRDNAWADQWGEISGNHTLGEINDNCTVRELPFIHHDSPFRAIGELGYITTDLTNRFSEVRNRVAPHDNPPPCDTISFASRSGAALLDLFTVNTLPFEELPEAPAGSEGRAPLPHRHSCPTYGLVQANTDHQPVIEVLFARGKLGWRPYPSDSSELSDLSKITALPDLSRAYVEALYAINPAGMGWRSLAEMLPSIATNESFRAAVNSPHGSYPTHEWVEDAVRHLPDHLSFRQNILLCVLAVQTLSEVSTPERPIVLAEQCAAATIIRDSFTGRWAIHSWRSLTARK